MQEYQKFGLEWVEYALSINILESSLQTNPQFRPFEHLETKMIYSQKPGEMMPRRFKGSTKI